MPGPYVNDEDVLESLARRLKINNGPNGLPAAWNGIVQEAIQQAYQDILAALGGRGFSVADIDKWASARFYNLQIAMYWTLVNGASLGGYPLDFIRELNLTPRLEKLAIMDTSGNPIIPSTTEPADSNGDGVDDTFGGAVIVGGRLDQTYWKTNENTVY